MNPALQALMALGADGVGKLSVGLVLPQLIANDLISDKAIALLEELPTSTAIKDVPVPILGTAAIDAFTKYLGKTDEAAASVEHDGSVFDAGHVQVCKLCKKGSWYNAEERFVTDKYIEVTCHHCDNVTQSVLDQ